MKLRGLVEDYYDIQRLRIATEGRVRSYKQEVSDQVIHFTKERVVDGLLKIEKDIYKKLSKDVKTIPIWAAWLSDVKGIGPVIACALEAWIGNITPRMETIVPKQGENKGKEVLVERGYKTISKLWANCGLKVDEETGRAVRKKKGERLHYNPNLKTLCWKIGESFVKSKGGYRDLYEQVRADYDRKWITGADCGAPACKSNGKSKKTPDGKCYDAHRYAAAKRKVVKIFLAHYWQMSRMILDLPVESPFIIGRDGHSHEIDIIRE